MSTLYAVGGGTSSNTGIIYYSADFVNWTRSMSPNIGPLTTIASVCSNGNIWVAGGGASTGNPTPILYSTDGGVNWIVSSSGSGLISVIYRIEFANGLFIATGRGRAVDSPVIAYSYDGITWNATNAQWGGLTTAFFGPNNTTAVCVVAKYLNGYWVAGAQSGTSGKMMGYSTDGKSWSLLNNEVLNLQVQDITYGNGTWVAVGLGTPAVQISYTSNLFASWTPVSFVPWPSAARSVHWNGTMFMAVGAGANIVKSYYGNVWTNVAPSPSTLVFNVNYLNNKWLIQQSDYYGVYGSTNDGTSWTNIAQLGTISGAPGTGTLSPIWKTRSIVVATTLPPSSPIINYVNTRVNGNTVVSFTQVSSYPEVNGYYYSVDGINYNSVSPNLVANTITITGTIEASPITIISQNSAGNSLPSNMVSIGGPPTINSVSVDRTSISVSFTSNGGYPAPSSYVYSVDGGTTFGNTIFSNVSPLTISNLAYGQYYSVAIKANSTAWISAQSNTVGPVYTVSAGTAPQITTGANILNGLSVNFIPSTGGNPAPTYYYSINGNTAANYQVANLVSNSNTFIVSNLVASTVYTVYLMAQNAAGNVYSANTYVGTPLGPAQGNAPVIRNITPTTNSLTVEFTESYGGNPSPTYYYSLDGSTVSGSGVSASPMVIPGLTPGTQYNVNVVALNLAGSVFSVAANATTSSVVIAPVVPPRVYSATEQVSIAFGSGAFRRSYISAENRKRTTGGLARSSRR